MVRINLEQIGAHDVNELAEEIKGEVRSALGALPRRLKASPSLRDPRRLTFLRAMNDEMFERNLRWYDLAMDDRSPRQIARREKSMPDDRRVENPPRRRRGGTPVAGEDAIAKAVAQLYEALHEKPYKGHASQRDAAERGLPLTYACPEHPGRLCPHGCRYRKWFMAHFKQPQGFWEYAPQATTFIAREHGAPLCAVCKGPLKLRGRAYLYAETKPSVAAYFFHPECLAEYLNRAGIWVNWEGSVSQLPSKTGGGWLTTIA
jgi:hypothetical protein